MATKVISIKEITIGRNFRARASGNMAGNAAVNAIRAELNANPPELDSLRTIIIDWNGCGGFEDLYLQGFYEKLAPFMAKQEGRVDLAITCLRPQLHRVQQAAESADVLARFAPSPMQAIRPFKGARH